MTNTPDDHKDLIHYLRNPSGVISRRDTSAAMREAADIIEQRATDTARLDFVLPVVAGDDDADINLRLACLMGSLMAGLGGREAVDTAMQTYAAKEKA